MIYEEKLAEEYRKSLWQRLTDDDDFERLEMFDENVEEAFIAGLEAGRLEAGRPKWHKVADGDLPTVGRRFLVSNRYCTMIGYWNGGTFVSADEDPAEIASPIAWCEIPKYKEAKNDANS